jgi:3-hydroxy acid dehydrogenase/malonic semialdehyde reductase
MNKIRISLLFFVALGLGSVLLIKHIDKLPPINTTTKTCLITGASSGIGQNIAIEMVKRGWKVIGVARRAEPLEKLQQKLGVNAFVPFVCDVGNLEQVHTTSESIKTMGLKPTLFFLNAGTGELRQKWQISVASHQRTFATNYFGVLAWIEEWLLPVKQLGGGTFVATSSVMALLATPGSNAYAASKIAIKHCFDGLRRQYLHDNIGFGLILPGPVNTEMLRGPGAKSQPFIHQPEDEARYIVEQVFKGNKQIEPSWYYSIMLRLLDLLPDFVVAKILAK